MRAVHFRIDAGRWRSSWGRLSGWRWGGDALRQRGRGVDGGIVFGHAVGYGVFGDAVGEPVGSGVVGDFVGYSVGSEMIGEIGRKQCAS